MDSAESTILSSSQTKPQFIKFIMVAQSFLSSTGNTDAVFRLTQYACVLVGGLGSDGSRKALFKAVASAVNSSRTIQRSFGSLDALHALQQLPSEGPSRTPELLEHLSMVVYFPLENLYFLTLQWPNFQWPRRTPPLRHHASLSCMSCILPTSRDAILSAGHSSTSAVFCPHFGSYGSAVAEPKRMLP